MTELGLYSSHISRSSGPVTRRSIRCGWDHEIRSSKIS